MPQQLQRLDHCLNCDQPVSGNFCSNCGQENENQTVALKLLVSDFLSEMISFDSKLFATLSTLLFHPGRLTRDYNAGRRIRFLSPFRLYLVSSVLFFFAAWWAMPADRLKPKSDSELAKATNMLGVGKAGAPDRKGTVKLTIEGENLDPILLPKSEAEYLASQRDPRNKHRDSARKQFAKLQFIRLRNDPAAFVRKGFDNAAKAMFLFVPVFAWILWVIYVRSHKLYVEHLIFALHCHAFLFLLLTAQTLVAHFFGRFLNPTILFNACLLCLLAYFLKAMRVVYGQSRMKTFVKFWLLAWAYLLLLGITLVAVFAVTFMLL